MNRLAWHLPWQIYTLLTRTLHKPASKVQQYPFFIPLSSSLKDPIHSVTSTNSFQVNSELKSQTAPSSLQLIQHKLGPSGSAVSHGLFSGPDTHEAFPDCFIMEPINAFKQAPWSSSTSPGEMCRLKSFSTFVPGLVGAFRESDVCLSALRSQELATTEARLCAIYHTMSKSWAFMSHTQSDIVSMTKSPWRWVIIMDCS